ncbi:universal stress protein [Halomonas stenophila]|uniref:Nucleotide-binding universal stress UspA family protein n=1 Tax=Halomonas stenophila TaxID=795312 RepID=A0A7W5EVG7_9GAMM|nr:universal stress protein [Halomonas stenophila]MBB3232204.1 nucleotide-binding universal stress UspA family protein [Halomonas stenophila]
MAENDRHQDGTEGDIAVAVARVLALLDASRHSLAALSAAVRLAEREGVELVAVYVEDQDLLHSVAFPFAREVGGHSGQVRRLTAPQLEASLARQAERVSQALELAVAGRRLRHSLQISRGRVIPEALSIATPGDIMLLGKAGLAGRFGARLGTTSLGLILSAPCPVVVWDEGRAPAMPGPLRVLVDPASGDAPSVPTPLSTLFDGTEAIPRRDAAALTRRLAVCRGGALLLHRDALRGLLAEDPDWLSRLAMPVVVVP